MFHQPRQKASQGDRVGICVTQFDPKLLERGLVSTPNYLSPVYSAIISVIKIPFFRDNLKSKTKFHVSMGHTTILAKITFFESKSETFDLNSEYLYSEELKVDSVNFALIEFEYPIIVIPDSLIIGSKLDGSVQSNSCRLAFKGQFKKLFYESNYQQTCLSYLKVYKLKHKQGFIIRANNSNEVIGTNLFKRDSNIQLFTGLKVRLSTGEEGIIESEFGKSGKVKIRIPGKKVRVKCNKDDTIKDLKKLIAAQTGTKWDKIVLKKWYTIYKDDITLDDYEIHDGMNLELYYQ